MTSTIKNPQKFLLAVDGSEHSQAATTLVGDLLKPQSEIIAVSVLSPLQTHQRSVLESALEQTQSVLQEREIKVAKNLLHGHPPSKIIEYANYLHPDLIVLGAKGLRATFGILLGGIAQQVVEHANQPVMVVRTPYYGLRRVLLVTDGSLHSQLAVEYLSNFPLPAGASLYVMHVLSPPPLGEMMAKTGFYTPFMSAAPRSADIDVAISHLTQEEEHKGKTLLESTVELIEASGSWATSVLQQGDAATEIISFAKERRIDLIIAGSRGLSQVRGWLMGSVSRKLVHYSDCSVLIVKGEPVDS